MFLYADVNPFRRSVPNAGRDGGEDCADAELGSLRLHDLRRTAAGQTVMSGENLPLVGKMLGHRHHRTTASYAHLADRHLVEAAEHVGGIIAMAIRGSAERRP